MSNLPDNLFPTASEPAQLVSPTKMGELVAGNIEAELLRCLTELEAAERQIGLQIQIDGLNYKPSSEVSILLNRIENIKTNVEILENKFKDVISAQAAIEAIRHQNVKHASFLLNIMKSQKLLDGLENEFQQLKLIVSTSTSSSEHGTSDFNGYKSLLTSKPLDSMTSTGMARMISTDPYSDPMVDTSKSENSTQTYIRKDPLNKAIMRQQSSGGQSRHPSFEPISEIDFLRVPEVTRRRAKLEDLNQLFIYLWRRATTGDNKWIERRQLIEAGFRCTGQGEAQLFTLRHLGLIELNRDGQVRALLKSKPSGSRN